MMEVYSRNTSDIIRYDFLRFNRKTSVQKKRTEAEESFEKKINESLEQKRDEMANDDGLGSYGQYKCPIF